MRRRGALLVSATVALACRHGAIAGAQLPAEARQLVVVTTPAWSSTAGEMRRYIREDAHEPWSPDGSRVPVVVGHAGLGWAGDTLGTRRDPRKREGDGRAPAGVFPLDTAFGFASVSDNASAALPYREITPGTECVDDTASAHYNTIVDRRTVRAVDWTSAERMREIGQYRMGVVVGYNARPPRRGRGSCIFLHIWAGPRSPTVGCTALAEPEMDALLRWLDPARRPLLVQLPVREYARLRSRWRLP